MDRITTLKQVLPFLREHRGQTFVVKVGGQALGDPAALRGIAEDLGVLDGVGIRLVVIHPAIEGAGAELIAALRSAGLRAAGLSGGDAGLIEAAPATSGADEAATITAVRPELLGALAQGGFIPVVAALAAVDGHELEVDADALAERLAAALAADKLFLLGDRRGLLGEPDDEASLVSWCDAGDVLALVERGAIADGMQATVDATLGAIAGGVAKVHIVSGMTPSALLLEVFTNEGCGTLVVRDRHAKGVSP